jgi:hypothetical protein
MSHNAAITLCVSALIAVAAIAAAGFRSPTASTEAHGYAVPRVSTVQTLEYLDEMYRREDPPVPGMRGVPQIWTGATELRPDHTTELPSL